MIDEQQTTLPQHASLVLTPLSVYMATMSRPQSNSRRRLEINNPSWWWLGRWLYGHVNKKRGGVEIIQIDRYKFILQ